MMCLVPRAITILGRASDFAIFFWFVAHVLGELSLDRQWRCHRIEKKLVTSVVAVVGVGDQNIVQCVGDVYFQSRPRLCLRLINNECFNVYLITVYQSTASVIMHLRMIGLSNSDKNEKQKQLDVTTTITIIYIEQCTFHLSIRTYPLPIAISYFI